MNKNEFQAAMEKHGNPVDAVLNEPFESWHIGSAMRLLAALARHLAAKEKGRIT